MSEDKINSLFEISAITAEMQAVVDGLNTIISARNTLTGQATSLFNLSEISQASKNIEQVNANLKQYQENVSGVAASVAQLNEAQSKLKESKEKIVAVSGSYQDLKNRIKEAKSELSNYDLGSDAAKKAQSEIFKLNTELKNANLEMRGMSNREVGRELTRMIRGAGEAAAGLALLMGSSKEEAEKFGKQLQKSLSILLMVEGGMKAYEAATRLAKWATLELNAVIEANPIGLVVVAALALAAGIYTIVNNWYDLNDAVDEFNVALNDISTKGLAEYNVELDKVSKKLDKAKDDWLLSSGQITKAEYDIVRGKKDADSEYYEATLALATKKQALINEVNDAEKKGYSDLLRAQMDAAAIGQDSESEFQEKLTTLKNNAEIARQKITEKTAELQGKLSESDIDVYRKLNDNKRSADAKTADESTKAYEKKLADQAKLDEAALKAKEKAYKDEFAAELDFQNRIFTERVKEANDESDLSRAEIDLKYATKAKETALISNETEKATAITQDAYDKQKDIIANKLLTIERIHQENITHGVDDETEYQAKIKENQAEALENENKFYDESLKNKEKSTKDKEKLDKELYDAEWQLASKTESAIFEIFSNQKDKQLQDLQSVVDADKAAKEKELLQAGNNQAQKDTIEVKYANIQKSRDAEKKKLDHDKAVAKKAESIFSIILDTAKGIMAALAETNVPLSIAIGALGAVELGIAASAAIPKYAKGRTGGPAELAVVGEKGVEGRYYNGELSFTPSTPTLAMLRQGEDIIPNDKLVSMGLDQIGTGKNINDSLQLHAVVNSIRSLEEVVKNKKEVHFIGTDSGIKAITKNGNSETEYINYNYRL